MIELTDVTVQFGEVRAVDGVTLTVNRGDVFGIVGFSGAGKSTLVRTINLLQPPTSGSVKLQGEELTRLSARELRKKRKKIGMIFQSFNLLSSRTILENVLYPIRREKKKADGSPWTKEEKREKAKHLLELVGIHDKADAYPSQLSGGQQQRCAIARSLASDPDILLCDEATSALDPKTTKQILDLLRNVNEQLGITIVIITHQMDVVKELCNRCAIMENGRIVESGSTIDIFAHPQKKLTKEFVESSSDTENTLERLRNHQIERSPGSLARIRYVGEAATEPLITAIYKNFKVETNILAGGIETIQGIPVGNLIVELVGPDEALKSAITYLSERQTDVELLGGQNGF